MRFSPVVEPILNLQPPENAKNAKEKPIENYGTALCDPCDLLRQ